MEPGDVPPRRQEESPQPPPPNSPSEEADEHEQRDTDPQEEELLLEVRGRERFEILRAYFRLLEVKEVLFKHFNF